VKSVALAPPVAAAAVTVTVRSSLSAPKQDGLSQESPDPKKPLQKSTVRP